ncbi:MAG: recombination protein O N-terminal domain-containing protein [Candidatus Kaiserbacteria bacterium]|nr:recombination protein O N-terminal domain-containing protein [Candidatus Kaiserbacteria bacterium]
MRHKYETRGVVLSRTSMGEANAYITLITPDLGLVRARAQGVRRSGAKLSAALATFTESSLVLVRGKESWRIAGAVLEENWFTHMKTYSRARAARVSGLLLRLVAGEAYDPKLFVIVTSFFKALTELPEEVHDAAEVLVVLRILAVLGLDTGEIPGETNLFTQPLLAAVTKNRTSYIARINHGIISSEL